MGQLLGSPDHLSGLAAILPALSAILSGVYMTLRAGLNMKLGMAASLVRMLSCVAIIIVSLVAIDIAIGHGSSNLLLGTVASEP